MLDLNKIPDIEEEVPISKEVNQEVVETVTTERSNVLIGSQGYHMGAVDAPLICTWQTLNPSELASLYNMVPVPVNSHRVHHVITHRANGTSEHAWISWLPAHHASLGRTVMHSSEWRTLPSIFHAAPPLPAHSISKRPLERAARPEVSSAFFDPPRPWSLGGLQQVPQATTNAIDGMECQGDSEKSDSNDDRLDSTTDHRNNMRTTKSMIPMGVRTPLESAQDQQDIGLSSQKGAENYVEAELNFDPPYVGAELLGLLAREEKRKMREAAFLAEFNFTTQRCTATAPCSTCLDFCKAPISVDLAESMGSYLGALYAEDDHPPVLKNMDEAEVIQKKGARHGPRSKSSEYRGVTFYKRTGRHEAAQVYLGASATKELAAKAYDKAAIMLSGPDVDINFEPESYQNEIRYLYKLSKEQLVIYLRRDSRGLGAQAAYPGVKRVKNHYQAICGETLLGTFSTEEEAARIVYRAAVQESFGTMASLIIDTHHVRKMPSFAAERYSALYPEAVKVMMLNKQSRSSKKESKSLIPPKKLSPLIKQKSSSEFAPVVPSAIASPNPVEQQPAIQINKNGPPAGKRGRSTWGQHLACRKAYKQTWATKTVTAHNPPRSIEPPSSFSRRPYNTSSPGDRISPSSATVLSALSGIGQTSTPSSMPACSVSSPSFKKRPMTSETLSVPAGIIKFKLFNSEITVAEETTAPEHHGQGNVNSPGAQTLRAGAASYTLPVTNRNQFDKLVLLRQTCTAMGEWSQYLPHALAMEMASGLTDVESINKRLHKILDVTAPRAPPTRITLERPEVRNMRLPNPNRCKNYRPPNRLCQQEYYEGDSNNNRF